MLESTDTNKPWRLKLTDYSPVLARKKISSDDIDLAKKQPVIDTQTGSLSDDEVFVKQSPKKAIAVRKIKPLNYNNNVTNQEATRSRCLKTISPEKRSGVGDGIPKKKVRFAIPEDMATSDDKPNTNDVVYNDQESVERRLKRRRLTAIGCMHDYDNYIIKKKRANSETDNYSVSLKLLCAQFADTDLGN